MAKLSGSSVARVVGALLVVYFGVQLLQGKQRGELVKTVTVNGQKYDLYFHRGSKHYSTITKNDVVVLDSRGSVELDGCIFDLAVVGSSATWTCHRSFDSKVLGAALP
jgi:hypothetical protein